MHLPKKANLEQKEIRDVILCNSLRYKNERNEDRKQNYLSQISTVDRNPRYKNNTFWKLHDTFLVMDSISVFSYFKRCMRFKSFA